MAVHRFMVEVVTDDAHVDAPDAAAIRNEIQNNLEYEAHEMGIESVVVQTMGQWTDNPATGPEEDTTDAR